MAESKYPHIRYQALDRCFRNKYKRYYIEDLMDACAEAIYDYAGIEEKCSRRTILNDILFMESTAGWMIPLERFKDGRRVYYRYSDTKFTINETLLDEKDSNKLKEAIAVLEKFKGLPCFEWMDDLLLKLQSGFKKRSNVIIEFEQAPSLKGLEHFDRLFNSILYKQTLLVTYTTYKGITHQWIIHPYLIKQYNKRWFLFGKNTTLHGAISNLPLDRIDKIEESGEAYIEDNGEIQAMLSSFIGVTIEDNPEIEIHLKFSEDRFPYIVTKPIHQSQTVLEEERTISLSVIPNKELEALILSYGNDVEVLSPEPFREQIRLKIQEMLKKY